MATIVAVIVVDIPIILDYCVDDFGDRKREATSASHPRGLLLADVPQIYKCARGASPIRGGVCMVFGNEVSWAVGGN